MTEQEKRKLNKFILEERENFLAWLVNNRNYNPEYSESLIIALRIADRYSTGQSYIGSTIYKLNASEIASLQDILLLDNYFLNWLDYDICFIKAAFSAFRIYKATKEHVDPAN